MKTKSHIVEMESYLNRMGYSMQTIKSYLYGIKKFLNTNPDAEKYAYKDVVRYVQEKNKYFNNSSSCSTLLVALKKYYDYLIDEGIRGNHPCRTLFLLRKRSNSVIHHDLFTSAELEMLMERDERYEILRLKNWVLISLLIYQGLTAGEIENLKVSHIDLDKGSVFIKESRKLTRRHLEMVPNQYKIFDQYIFQIRSKSIKTETDSLLVGKLGTPITVDDINYLVSTFKPYFPERNLNPKTIRQSVISNWLNEKHLPLEQVQLMAGHRWVSATIKYRITSDADQRELINRFHPLNNIG